MKIVPTVTGNSLTPVEPIYDDLLVSEEEKEDLESSKAESADDVEKKKEEEEKKEEGSGDKEDGSEEDKKEEKDKEDIDAQEEQARSVEDIKERKDEIISEFVGKQKLFHIRRNISDLKKYEKQQQVIDKTKRPPNFEEAYPVDIKILELQQHMPRVKEYEISYNLLTMGDDLSKYILDVSERTEQRLVRLENILSTVMRYTYRMGARVNINCVYYGGQSEYEKYKCIRCLNPDRMTDGALMSIDQCLVCTRYEPIIGQVYDILDQEGSNLALAYDDLRLSYQTSDGYKNTSIIEEYADKTKKTSFKPEDASKKDETEKDILDVWSEDKGLEFDWRDVYLEHQFPHVGITDLEGLEEMLYKHEGVYSDMSSNVSTVNPSTGKPSSGGSYDDGPIPPGVPGTASATKYDGPTYRLPLDSSTLQKRVAAISSLYGKYPRRKGEHYGLDISIPTGTPIYAAADGVVRTAGWSDASGYNIIIKHGSGTKATGYQHLSKLKVKKGQSVKRGELIGYSGNTGDSTGPHLHFDTWERVGGSWKSKNDRSDPARYLRGIPGVGHTLTP